MQLSVPQLVGYEKSKVRVAGPHCLNEDGELMSPREQMAVVSHYVHNEKYASAKPYEAIALGILQD